jgi:hypothetical protein
MILAVAAHSSHLLSCRVEVVWQEPRSGAGRRTRGKRPVPLGDHAWRQFWNSEAHRDRRRRRHLQQAGRARRPRSYFFRVYAMSANPRKPSQSRSAASIGAIRSSSKAEYERGGPSTYRGRSGPTRDARCFRQDRFRLGAVGSALVRRPNDDQALRRRDRLLVIGAGLA